jgi:hypothetical protein
VLFISISKLHCTLFLALFTRKVFPDSFTFNIPSLIDFSLNSTFVNVFTVPREYFSVCSHCFDNVVKSSEFSSNKLICSL